MSLSDFLNQILIVIVVYKKDIRQILANTIPHHCSANIFVYDNSPDFQDTNDMGVIYQHDPTNPGVSKAYNEAFKTASQMKKKWMLLLDQDTVVNMNIFSSFAEGIKSYPEQAVLVPFIRDSKSIISPYQFFLGRGVRVKKVKSGLHNFSRFNIINSGMLIRTEAFHKAGGYDERFPMDLSDVVFVERLSKLYPEFVLVDSICQHHLSMGASKGNAQDAMHRFNFYCKAIRYYRRTRRKSIVPILSILPVALKLLIRYRKFEILRIAFRS
jgi:GT2 family glycosyltransferase